MANCIHSSLTGVDVEITYIDSTGEHTYKALKDRKTHPKAFFIYLGFDSDSPPPFFPLDDGDYVSSSSVTRVKVKPIKVGLEPDQHLEYAL